ncbi:DUF6544 family protein [uncultured Lentibacter sp.]|jgi:hypothetical protein|uniref:DUF6544 family protein n=1 Tax=uncultured Lentibacter sp. TaxID=1659309 RepID=UPI002608297E|nr:DUF6544 family protein [uncultured Lentibacter sp.]
MLDVLLLTFAILAFAMLFLAVMARREASAEAHILTRLFVRKPAAPPAFSHDMLAALPAPAQRFFRFTIAEGTPLTTVAEVTMQGRFDLGSKDAPNPQPMQARQVLAPPRGFLWTTRIGKKLAITGSDGLCDGRSWSRFRLAGLFPVARAGGNPDHLLSSFGRLVGDALLWTPAAFLPATNTGWDSLTWQSAAPDTATVTVTLGTLSQSADIVVDEEGRLVSVRFARWSNENPEKTYTRQPFGGDITAHETFAGFTLPTALTAGNHYGTEAYHIFFDITVSEVRI